MMMFVSVVFLLFILIYVKIFMKIRINITLPSPSPGSRRVLVPGAHRLQHRALHQPRVQEGHRPDQRGQELQADCAGLCEMK